MGFSGLFFVSLVISVVFSQVVSPMLLAYLVLAGGIVVMMALGLVFSSFWLSYIILLTFLGGLLVVFVYVASLSPNEPVLSVGKFSLLVGVVVLFYMLEWESGSDFNFGSSFLFLAKMFLGDMSSFIVVLVIYLFLVLLVVVDLSFVVVGPLSMWYDKEA